MPCLGSNPANSMEYTSKLTPPASRLVQPPCRPEFFCESKLEGWKAQSKDKLLRSQTFFAMKRTMPAKTTPVYHSGHRCTLTPPAASNGAGRKAQYLKPKSDRKSVV